MDSQTTSPTLFVADTDETQAYVFESNKLPEIRGASRQLFQLNQSCEQTIIAHGGEVIYAGGGGLLALVPQPQAADLVTRIETSYPNTTGVATITAAARPLPSSYREAEFGSYVSWANSWLKSRKESKGAPPFISTLPFESRCSSCHKRAADPQYLTTTYPDPICAICYNKRESGRRSVWVDEFELHLRALERQALFNSYYKNTTSTVEAAYSISEISAANRARSGYVAFVYLDGDRIGRSLRDLSRQAYTAFSATLRQATRAAVFEALATHLNPHSVPASDLRPEATGETITIHPFEIITIGGDDVLLIVPAHAGIPIATTISQRFQKLVAQESSHEASMSAGVVLADDHTPVITMVNLVRQLLKQAKRPRYAAGGIDFHILKSADMLDSTVAGMRQQYPYLQQNINRKQRIRLVARPYRVADMATMWQELKALKQGGFPNTQMNMLAESLLDGRATATLYYAYQKARDKKSHYQQLTQILTQLQATGDEHPLPWQQIEDQYHRYQTALWDIAELYPFVP